MEGPELRAAVRAEVRAYMAGAAARYVPVLAAVLAVVLLVVVVPDTRRVDDSGLAGGAAGQAAQDNTAASGNGAPAPGAIPGSTTAGAAPGAAGNPGSGTTGTGGTGPGISNSTTGSSVAGTGPGVASKSGTAVTGAKCGAGARQFSWAPYSPPCVAKWTGRNSGASAHGVTASTITMVLRNPSDWDSLAASTNSPKFAGIAHDTQVLVNYFNRQYELYGRKVVVKTFNGKGSFVSEGANQGQANASSDAQTAYDMGAFVDGFPFATGTYADAEASRRIVHFAPGNSVSAYKSNAPYRYGMPAGPVNEIQGAGVASFACQRLAKMPAIFAGDATYQKTPRKFAVIEPEQPQFAGGSDIVVSQMKSGCGQDVKAYRYSADVSSEAQQGTQITAQMKADGITTILMLTDPIMVQFMTAAASKQQYNPEWAFTVLPANLARQADAAQMAHAIAVQPWPEQVQAQKDRLCYRIYKLADPNGAPQAGPTGLDLACSMMLAVFGALQEAGPTLTPQNFSKGWFSMPDSNGASDFGRWSFGQNQYSPLATFSVTWWNPNAADKYDGGTGQFQACSNLANEPYKNPKLGSGQPSCFGH